MTGVDDDSRDRHSGRPWLVVGFLLAVGATLALVLTEDLRWLRLGIVAALWAALIGAFVAARYRKQVAATEESVAQAQEVYELELEREIAARREFELEIEAETRQRVEEDSREELEALRSEVTALRESLQALFGGEVLYERVALTAQSTRMRSLSDEPRVVTGGESNGTSNGSSSGKKPAQLVAGKKKVVEATDRPTELIDRVRDPAPPAAQRRGPAPPPAPGRQPEAAKTAKTQFVPRPARPAENGGAAGPPTRRVQPANGTGSAAARASEAANRARAEMSRPRQQPVERPPERARREQPDPPTQQVRQPSSQRKPRERAPEPRQYPSVEHTRPEMEPSPRGRPASSVAPPSRNEQHDPEPQRKKPEPFPVARPEPEHSAPAPQQQPEQAPQPASEARPEPNPTLPPEIRDLAARPGGRRRRPEPDDEPAETRGGGRHGGSEPPVGGRRRRGEGEQPWQGYFAGEEQNGSQPSSPGGSHARPDANGSTGGRRRAPEPADEAGGASGSHAEGRSVSELLAAHGASTAAPRRRRRAED
ncbi:DUF6779 domain-containing protein [Qaidamihabitans albus]|uniref:DUF6779 domain-containing protein n=1 Tax=Qaidamihabitans albus TaxID=2795733 RepID=UPI0018F16BF8|nr:DUF6779 domain-containing protein [Qaidamihabitans albus]